MSGYPPNIEGSAIECDSLSYDMYLIDSAFGVD